MKKLLLTVTALAFLSTGCSTIKGTGIGVAGGVSAVEQQKGNISDKVNFDNPVLDAKFSFGYLSGLHVALAVGLFIVNPIAGGAYLGANAIYGAGRLTETSPKHK